MTEHLVSVSDLVPTYLFEIQASTQDVQRDYYSNLKVTIVTTDMERAITLFRRVYPNARLHQVLRRNRYNEQVIIDSVVARES